MRQIDLPYGPQELEAVTAAVSSGAFGGVAVRCDTSSALARWRECFASLGSGAVLAPPLRWSLLHIDRDTQWPPHQHMTIEVAFVLSGTLCERRLLAQPDGPVVTGAVPDDGAPELYTVVCHTAGECFANPRYSVHQSYTRDEGAVVLTLWGANHARLRDAEGKLWDASRQRRQRRHTSNIAASGARSMRAPMLPSLVWLEQPGRGPTPAAHDPHDQASRIRELQARILEALYEEAREAAYAPPWAPAVGAAEASARATEIAGLEWHWAHRVARLVVEDLGADVVSEAQLGRFLAQHAAPAPPQAPVDWGWLRRLIWKWRLPSRLRRAAKAADDRANDALDIKWTGKPRPPPKKR